MDVVRIYDLIYFWWRLQSEGNRTTFAFFERRNGMLQDGVGDIDSTVNAMAWVVRKLITRLLEIYHQSGVAKCHRASPWILQFLVKVQLALTIIVPYPRHQGLEVERWP